MALCSHKPLSPCAEVIKDVQKLFGTGWDVQFDAWLCYKGNKITSSLCDTRPALGVPPCWQRCFGGTEQSLNFCSPHRPKVEGGWSQVWSSFGCSSEGLEPGECCQLSSAALGRLGEMEGRGGFWRRLLCTLGSGGSRGGGKGEVHGRARVIPPALWKDIRMLVVILGGQSHSSSCPQTLWGVCAGSLALSVMNTKPG